MGNTVSPSQDEKDRFLNDCTNNRVEALGRTALILSAINGYTDIVKMLIEAKAAVDLQDKFRRTALIMSVVNGHTDIVKVLIATGAAVDLKNIIGRTPLIVSAINGHTDIMKILIEAGAVLALQDKGNADILDTRSSATKSNNSPEVDSNQGITSGGQGANSDGFDAITLGKAETAATFDMRSEPTDTIWTFVPDVDIREVEDAQAGIPHTDESVIGLPANPHATGHTDARYRYPLAEAISVLEDSTAPFVTEAPVQTRDSVSTSRNAAAAWALLHNSSAVLSRCSELRTHLDNLGVDSEEALEAWVESGISITDITGILNCLKPAQRALFRRYVDV